jgi:hypothetical protein
MICTAKLHPHHPNKASKLVLEAVGDSDVEFLTCLAAAMEHQRCIRVFKTDDPYGKHCVYHSGETDEASQSTS